MATLTKTVQGYKAINYTTKLLTNLFLSSNVALTSSAAFIRSVPPCQIALLHTSCKRNDLMEFFDNKKNWGKTHIQVGRSWRKDELRIKSNEDLHKLWYVLLKERNMLLTMQAEYERESQYFPNAERIDKVEESMENLESVVRERNRAYYLLETGETGERPAEHVHNQIGIKFFYRMREHVIPKFMNTTWHKKYKFGYGGYAVAKFRRLYREVLLRKKLRAQHWEEKHVQELMKIYPNLDLEAVKEKYTLVDVDKLKNSKDVKGHWAS